MKRNEHASMNEEDDSGVLGHRRVLGDVTNSLGKRRLLSPAGGSVLEKKNGCGKIADGRLEDDEFGRRGRKGVENSVKEKENVSVGLFRSGNVPVGDGKNVSLLKVKRPCRSTNSGNGGHESSQENVAPDVSETPLAIREPPKSLNCDLQLSRGELVMREIMEGDGSRDSCNSSACLPRQCDKVRDSSPISGDFQDDYGNSSADVKGNAAVIDDTNEAPVMSAHEKSDKGKGVAEHWQFSTSNACNFQVVGSQESKTDGGEGLNQAPLDKMGSTACLGESGSLGSKLFGIEGSGKAQVSCSGDAGLNPNDCVESDKTCSCPFCLKAAYLWSDLNYQDVRERLNALKKSRRQVRQLVASYNYSEFGQIAHDGSDRSAKIELDLMHQWQSLFLQTEDALVHESNRLQSDLLKLRNLKENCERDLEMTKGVP
ncbi:hypothetical protein CKAN_02224100 [Cinnamomum micranthum f. kanehirae]|uniref:Uncharacterized protein n=1 Tax=Cinnamomum micranthum f. kanehirae TaxID=337451 RepID=A0A3S3NRN0_9MAGN|nr:hypothetical protein CKAN_02224100 [Cinnamomum micranthum f. kanehirae]